MDPAHVTGSQKEGMPPSGVDSLVVIFLDSEMPFKRVNHTPVWGISWRHSCLLAEWGAAT